MIANILQYNMASYIVTFGKLLPDTLKRDASSEKEEAGNEVEKVTLK